VAAKGKYFGAGFGVQRYEKGYSFAKSLRDEKFVRAHDDQAGNTDSKGAKRLRRFEAKTTAYGGSSASPGTSTVVTMVLTKGTYTVFDEATAVPSHPSILHVTGSTSHRSAPASRGTIIAKPGDRFGGSKTLPAHGTIAFRNHGDQDHFVALVQVQNGTTHKQVADYFAQQTQAPPAFALGEAVGSDLVSPHHSMTFTEKAPKGEYVEVCFMQDDKTGMQHAYMGMFRIVHLR
jgi:hypothetical protein